MDRNPSGQKRTSPFALVNLFKTSVFRLTLTYIVLFAAASALLVGIFFPQANRLFSAQVRETLSAEVTGLREQFELGGVALLARALRERSSEPGGGIYLLVDRAGGRIAGNLDQLPGKIVGVEGGGTFTYAKPYHARRKKNLARQSGPDQPASSSETVERQAFGILISVEGGYQLLVGRDTQDQRVFVRNAKKLMLIGLALMVGFGVIAGVLASRAVLRRIGRLTSSADEIIDGQLNRRLQLTGSGDEFDQLARRLNQMLDRIEELVAGIREVTDNIAHDLKTPLTRLRAGAETALRETAAQRRASAPPQSSHSHPHADSPAADAHLRGALHDVVSEADRLIVTFNALLNISRLEAGAGHLELEPVDLRELVTDIAETYEPVADEAGARLTVTMPAGQNPVMSQGNGALLAQLLANLLDNALKYGQPAPPPGAAAGARDAALIAPEIGVVLDSRPDRLIIEIADNGPGIAPEDRARAFDRFTRLDASRSAPGSGLGMSLALAIARLHAGELSLHDNGPGLRVRLALPRPAER